LESFSFIKLLLGTSLGLHWVIAGLDVGRYQWSGIMPPILQIIALVILIATMVIGLWVYLHNPFASPVIRIQSERGHYVVTTGPYKYIRHPIYFIAILGVIFGPITLGSWWAILPTIPTIVFIFRRTVREDRFLQAELPGYTEYSAKVPYRLIPGIW